MLQNALDYRAQFESWRPRAPTLMVFEDPHIDEAATLINWLIISATQTGPDNTQHPYAFSVRLLIVNQMLPLDLGLECSRAVASA